MKTHRLKTKTEYFKQNMAGKKPCTIRKNDRDFKIGDIVIKEEINELGEKTGRTSRHEIINIIEFPDGLKKGYVLLILRGLYKFSNKEKIPFDELDGKWMFKQNGIYYIIEDDFEFPEAIRTGIVLFGFDKERIEYEISHGWVEKVINWSNTKIFYDQNILREYFMEK